jgi:formylglycine-generating enzyme required for sulfatase activity
VRITQPFFIGVHEVTVAQFRQFVEATGYPTDAEHDGKGAFTRKPGADRWKLDPHCNWSRPGFKQTENHPVVGVSWNDADVFCKWLSRKEQRKYRLPTEAEWEYACRAGSVTRFHNGDDPEQLVRVANVSDAALRAEFPRWPKFISGSDGYPYTSPVGRFDPNAWGLYDMHGNALEWCQDRYSPDSYIESSLKDPKGPHNGTDRVVRGGCYLFRPLACRCAFRAGRPPGDPTSFTGFRVVQVPATKRSEDLPAGRRSSHEE